MIKKPIYEFSDTSSIGLDKVPLYSLIKIKSDNHGITRYLILIDKTNINSSTTILEFIDDFEAHKDFYDNFKLSVGTLNAPVLSLPLENSLVMINGEGSIEFSRASTAYYIDRYGVIQYADIDEPRFEREGLLMEGPSENIMLYSEDFTNSFWIKEDCSITSNATTAPDGTTTADKMIDTTATNAHSIRASVSNALTGDIFTLSCFAKASELNYVALYSYGTSFTTNPKVCFDLNNQTMIDAGEVSILDSKMEELDNGWYRISMTYIADADGNHSALISLNDSLDTSITYTGNGSSGAYIWGAQLELLKFSSSYIPTTSSTLSRSADKCLVYKEHNLLDWNQELSLSFDISVLNYTHILNRLILYDGYLSNGYFNINTVGSCAVRFLAGDILNSDAQIDLSMHRNLYTSDGINIHGYIDGLRSESGVVGSGELDETKTSFFIGGDGNLGLFGHIRKLRIWDKKLNHNQSILV